MYIYIHIYIYIYIGILLNSNVSLLVISPARTPAFAVTFYRAKGSDCLTSHVGRASGGRAWRVSPGDVMRLQW